MDFARSCLCTALPTVPLMHGSNLNKHIFLNKEAAFENGLERPIEAWKCPRVLIDLDHVQRASPNSKPFSNAASLLIQKNMFVQIPCISGRG